jgi:hypothetical protein
MKTKILFIVICNLIICNMQYSQSIINRLGTNGVFTIKDISADFLQLSQANGSLYLYRNMELGGVLTSSSTRGILTKNGLPFIHNYSAPGSYGFNTFVGINSGNLYLGSTQYVEGSANTGVGGESLNSLTTGYQNSAFGYRALFKNNTGISNSAFGVTSMNFNTSGSLNSSFGYQSMYLNGSGSSNNAFGYWSLANNSSGSQNSAYGNSSLYLNQIGFQNTAIGNSSLVNNNGNYNTAIGYNSGSTITTGANLTCVGTDAAPTTPTAIDQVTLGNGFVNSLRCNVQTITSLSDMRDKKNITELSLGLDFIEKLKPRQFNWDKREWYDDNISDGSKMKETPTAGFIAQELDEAQTTAGADWLNLVLKDNPEKWEATYGNLLPVMVKAIQELKAENDELKSSNEKLTAQVETLSLMGQKLAKLEQLVKDISSVKNASLSDIK